MQYDSTKQKQQSSTLHNTRFGSIKWIIIKLVSSMSIAEIEYNIVKPYVHYLLLTYHFEPFIASIIARLGWNNRIYYCRKFECAFYRVVQKQSLTFDGPIPIISAVAVRQYCWLNYSCSGSEKVSMLIVI